MCQQRITTCSECKKDSDGLMRCDNNGHIEYLCPDCLEKGKDYCLGCGEFCAGITSFDFTHPGYCDTCWDDINEADNWDDEDTNYWDDDEEDYDPFPDDDSEDEFRDGSLDY